MFPHPDSKTQTVKHMLARGDQNETGVSYTVQAYAAWFSRRRRSFAQIPTGCLTKTAPTIAPHGDIYRAREDADPTERTYRKAKEEHNLTFGERRPLHEHF